MIKTKPQIVKEKNEKIRNTKEKIKRLVESNKKLKDYKPPQVNTTRRYKLERINRLKLEKNKKKLDLYNIEIEIVKMELSLINY